MPHPPFDRSRLSFRPLGERESKFSIEAIRADPDGEPPDPGRHLPAIERIAERVAEARARGAPVVLCHGAHVIKNGLGPLLVRLVEEGWLTQVATNGAGSIHDWEFAFLGKSCEDVRRYATEGQFGLWEETGKYTGLALLTGAVDGLGYGEAIGRMAHEERLVIPERQALEEMVAAGLARGGVAWESAAAAADLLAVLDECGVPSGELELPHPHAHRSVQAACFRRGVAATVHPGIGQDIVYTHPLVRGGAAGRTSMRDFLVYAEAIRRLEGGVYLSIGSSVMSPMVFEKSVSMARNVLRREGRELDEFLIAVNDLADSSWDWSRGEPPVEDPAYYVRFLKSFSRMGGELEYVGLDNRAFLLNLYRALRRRDPARR